MHNGRVNNFISAYQTKIRIGDKLVKIIKSIDHKRLQSSFYEKLIILNEISTFLLKKKKSIFTLIS